MMQLFEQGTLLQVLAVAYLGCFAFFALRLSLSDAKEHRLPNRQVLGWALTSTPFLISFSILRADYQSLIFAIIGGLALGGGYLLLWLLGRGAMGMGDVKLAGVLGLNLGYFSLSALLLATIVAFVSASLVVLIGVVFRRLTLKSLVPFGPFMILGAAVALVVTP